MYYPFLSLPILLFILLIRALLCLHTIYIYKINTKRKREERSARGNGPRAMSIFISPIILSLALRALSLYISFDHFHLPFSHPPQFLVHSHTLSLFSLCRRHLDIQSLFYIHPFPSLTFVLFSRREKLIIPPLFIFTALTLSHSRALPLRPNNLYIHICMYLFIFLAHPDKRGG